MVFRFNIIWSENDRGRGPALSCPTSSQFVDSLRSHALETRLAGVFIERMDVSNRGSLLSPSVLLEMTPPFRLAKFGNTYIQTITDLTFEVSAAVARLAISIKDWSDGRSPTTESLLAQTGVENDTPIETEPGASGRAGSDSPAQLLQNGSAATKTALLDELPSLVRDQVSSVRDQVRDQMSEQLRDLVRDAVRAEMERQQDVAEVASLSPSEMRRSRLWGAFSWGSR
ncbi:hypothetical protein J7T55_012269 [Diaporthe amygdali]|uniref:uncharacterized protein n=1 Tax=Phomopsis amygdali TaxID=1214568 RepID=UPI0022FDFA7E|nr:uncharacterized protein J7T55_012269 [Diaporthe amygdali]KAJ0123799.1 hypothetical protein J7T55_012269 [Diaporthe amygdali]